MRQTTLIIIAFSLLLSCKHASRPPDNLIPKKVMGKVLLDVNFAEAYSVLVKDTVHRPGTKNTDSLIVFYKDIFNHYKITPQQFTGSLYWYKGHPEELDSIYSSMIPVATRWQTMPPASMPAPSNKLVEHK